MFFYILYVSSYSATISALITNLISEEKTTKPTFNIELQYAGKAIPYDEIVKRAKEATETEQAYLC